MKAGMIALILVPVLGALIVYHLYLASIGQNAFSQDWLKLFALLALSVVLPLLAYSYFFFRKERRGFEIDRIIATLNLEATGYVEMFKGIHSGAYFVVAVGLTWMIALSGLSILFFGDDLWASEATELGFPQEGSRLVFGMAFLGAYVWGLQYVLRRYVVNDLVPGAFFKLTLRMLMASTVALILFNAFESLAGDDADGLTVGVWPTVAFLLGIFPQRGLDWLVSKIPLLSDHPDNSVRRLRLTMIEGLDAYDRMRLEEIGIHDCFGLANYDFVPLVLRTSYDARTVADWILQAKLCVRCGDAIATLRQQGIRGIHELAELTEEDVNELANGTTATLSSLQRSRSVAMNDPDIRRLQEVAGRLSRFTGVSVTEAAER